MIKIHKPGKKFSNKLIGNPNNPLIEKEISNTELITIETWDKDLMQPWKFGEHYPYKLMMTWVEGQNYAITKVIDGNEALVYYYCDISSSVIKKGKVFELEDWYLDVIKKPGEEPIICDQDEFNEAVRLGYLTPEQALIAEKTMKFVLNMLQELNGV